MSIFIYIVIFAIGATIGSFCTLAVYRIPLKKDITHERSFCPNCNHRLEFLDLIPIFSYIFLGGKCRYCGKKIRIRYLLLELLAGFATLGLALSLKFDMPKLEIAKYVDFFISILYITGIAIIAGIDKEKKQIEKPVLIYNMITSATYILYLFVVGETNINRYAIYLFFVLALLAIRIIDKHLMHERRKPVGFYIAIANTILIIMQNFITYYR